MKDAKRRKDIVIGQVVSVVLKTDQKAGRLTRGVVQTILTKSPMHPHGIKVRMDNGLVGRIKIIHDEKVITS